MKLPYHPNNLDLVTYPAWRLILLAWAGKWLDIQFHVQGIPFGGRRSRNEEPSDSIPAQSTPTNVG